MKLLCDGWNSNGVISILLLTRKGKTIRYEYDVDTALIPGWIKRISYQPGIVLHEIMTKSTGVKRLC